MRSRPTQALLVFLSLVVGALAPIATPVIAQDTGTPPQIEPSNGQGSGGVLETNFELGNGGQPEDFPREITVDNERFLFDRMVPASRQELVPVASEAEIQALATTETGPFDAIYLSVPPRNEDELGRYLPEQIGADQITCPAETGNFGQLDAGGAIYVFAGIETFLTAEDLEQVANDSDGQPVYADPGQQQPFAELFFTDPNGLVRFALTTESGAPVALSESLALDGAQFAFEGEVTGQVDLAAQTKIGCAGPYPVYGDADPASGTRYAAIGERVFQYTGEAPAAEPTEEPTEQPTEIAATPEPTEVPTEVPAEAPTEEPTATTEPTATASLEPTATTEPTDIPTEEPVETTEAPPVVPAEGSPTSAPTEPGTTAASPPASAGTPGAATATVAPPDTVVEAASEASAPEQVNVQGTIYFFSSANVDIEIASLVQVEVITVNQVDLTVYADQAFTGVAPRLYCVDSSGKLVGVYMPAAESKPPPPAALPPTIEVNNTTFVFNQVEINVNIQNLTQVEVTTINNIAVTIYVEQFLPGTPTRYYAVSSDGTVVGMYVSVVVIQQSSTAPIPKYQPPAVAPTQEPDAPPPAAVTAEAAPTCAGNPGPINAQGLPTYLPNRIQFGGISYALVGPENLSEAGTLTRIGCIGAFEVTTTDKADRSEVLYLRYTGGGEAGASVYRFNVATTFEVQFEITGDAQRIQAGEQVFRLTAVWTKTIHTSGSVNLFVANPDEQSPDVYYGVNVSNTVVGDVIGEYRKADANAVPEEDMVAAGERYGLHADLIVRGERYLLVNVFLPVGTTTNGFLTLFSATGEVETEILLGRDKREVELFIYEPDAQETGG